jgi:hypothetical protein
MPGFSVLVAGIAEADDELRCRLAHRSVASQSRRRSGSRGFFGSIVATADSQDGGHDRVFTVGQGLHALRQGQAGDVDGGAGLQILQVDFDELRQIARQALDGQFGVGWEPCRLRA